MSERKYFRPQKNIVELPNLIEIQKQSYDWLFEEGIKELLDEISPVDDFTGEAFTLESVTIIWINQRLTKRWPRKRI